MVKNLVFDFGGVLLDLHFDKCMSEFWRLGFAADDINKDVFSSGIFQQMNIGTIDPLDFVRQLKKLSKSPSVSDGEIVKAWNMIIGRIPPQRFEALKILENQYDIYLLSNTNVLHWDYSLENVWEYEGQLFTSHFKRIFLSCEMHKEKPNADIFEELIDEAKILPSETLFIDDSKDNVEAAAKLGIHALQALGDEWIDKIINKELDFLK